MRFLIAMAGLLVASAGCQPSAPANPLAKMPRLTFFAADNSDFPAVAKALNERVAAKFPRGGTVAYAGVSLEEAQLAVGCIEATPECWAAVAKSVTAPGLLLAEVGGQKVDGQSGKGVRVSVRIFDSEGRATLRVSERAAATAEEALAAVPKVVDALLTPASR